MIHHPVLHREEASAERLDVERQSRAAGCALDGLLVSNSTDTRTAKYRAMSSWTFEERNRRRNLKAIELRLRKLGANE